MDEGSPPALSPFALPHSLGGRGYVYVSQGPGGFGGSASFEVARLGTP